MQALQKTGTTTSMQMQDSQVPDRGQTPAGSWPDPSCLQQLQATSWPWHPFPQSFKDPSQCQLNSVRLSSLINSGADLRCLRAERQLSKVHGDLRTFTAVSHRTRDCRCSAMSHMY